MATRNRLLVLLLQTSKLITILFCPLVHFWTSTVRILFCRLVHIWTSTVVQGDLAPVCVSCKFSLDDSPICLICYNYRPEEVNTSNTCFFLQFLRLKTQCWQQFCLLCSNSPLEELNISHNILFNSWDLDISVQHQANYEELCHYLHFIYIYSITSKLIIDQIKVTLHHRLFNSMHYQNVRRSPPRRSPPQTFITPSVKSDVHHPRRSPPQTFTTPCVKSDVHHPRRSPPQTFTTPDIHHPRRSPPPV